MRLDEVRRPVEVAPRLAPGCVWIVGGRSALAGEYRGREEVLAFLARASELTGGTYRVELIWELSDEERAVVYCRAAGRRPDGRELDLDQALVCRVEDGLWTEVRALPYDQSVFDAFWSWR